MTKIGDKFVIEVAEILGNPNGKKLYLMKGFNTLVFDEHGITKLEKYSQENGKTFHIGDVICRIGDDTLYVVVGHKKDTQTGWYYKVLNTKTYRIGVLYDEDTNDWEEDEATSSLKFPLSN